MYGIGLAVEGINRGVEQHRQIKRQEADDQRRQAQHDAQMKSYGIQQQAAQQRLDQNQTEFGWKQDDRERLQITREEEDFLSRGQQLAAMAQTTGDYTLLTPIIGEMFERVYDVSPDAVVPAEDAYLVTINGQTQRVPFSEALNQSIYTPKELIETRREAEKMRRQAEAEAEKARLEHRRGLETEAMKQGSIVGDFNDEGEFGLRNAPPGMQRGENMTALERNTQHYMAAFGMDERTATLAASGRLRPDEAQRQALALAQQFIEPGSLMSVRTFTRTHPQQSAELGITDSTEPMEAIRILQDHYAKQFSGQMSYEGYGINPAQPAPSPAPGPSSAPPGRAQSPTQSAGSAIDVATQRARQDPRLVEPIYRWLIEDQNVSREEADRWKASVTR